MQEQRIRLDRGERNLSRLVGFLSALPKDEIFEITIKKAGRKRTETQNAKLWAVYDEIIRLGGEEMAGWTKDDLHDFFLGNHFGWEVRTLWGKKKQVPRRRSSKLNKLEFADFLESIFRFMSERGLYIP